MRTLQDLKKIADEKGWMLNPKQKIVSTILKLENENHEKAGVYFCPCKPNLVDVMGDGLDKYGNKIRIFVSACPCVDAGKEIKEDGHCHCNLFVRNN